VPNDERAAKKERAGPRTNARKKLKTSSRLLAFA
jgi:hypothetical protein